jgi:DNA-binding NtrC family response regulator
MISPPGPGEAGLPPTLTESPVLTVASGLHLVILHPGGVRAIPVPPGADVRVGRSPECEVCLESPLLSRTHFAIRDGAPPMLMDLRSANGTKVNGQRVEPGATVPLEAGSLIEAGGTFFAVQDHAPHELTAPPPLPRPISRPGQDSDAPGVVVIDPAMVRLHELVALVARSSIPVLVLGETGAGKEVISAGIHRRSARADKPFVSLNCAALPEALLESELFGYEKGSFTGASQAKAGLIESAHEGTLFLDEIGEMPLPTQAKLLRVLEDGALLRLGALKPRHVDVRFIAATNADVPQLVARGAFRRDLYFRLNGITIPVPALRERRSEIGPLAQFFLGQGARKAGRSAPSLTAEALQRLASHSWPGNIRELRNVMDRALALSSGGIIAAHHVLLDPELPAVIPAAGAGPTTIPPPPPPPPVEDGRLMRMSASDERRLIVEALERCGGNQSKACKLLGISRRTLLHRLDEHGIERPRKGRD